MTLVGMTLTKTFVPIRYKLKRLANRSVVTAVIPLLVAKLTLRLVAVLTPNSKLSTVNNISVNDSSASLTSFKNNKDKNDKDDDAKAIADYIELLSKSYPNLDVTKEFMKFNEAHPNVDNLNKIAQLFTEWCIDANERKDGELKWQLQH